MRFAICSRSQRCRSQRFVAKCDWVEIAVICYERGSDLFTFCERIAFGLKSLRFVTQVRLSIALGLESLRFVTKEVAIYAFSVNESLRFVHGERIAAICCDERLAIANRWGGGAISTQNQCDLFTLGDSFTVICE